MTENEYYDQWINKEVTLSQWRKGVTLSPWEKCPNLNHWEIVDQLDLEEEQIHEIEEHQLELFYQAIRQEVKIKVDRLNASDNSLKQEIVNDHLRLINSYCSSTTENPFLLELLSSARIVSIRVQDYLQVLKSIQNKKSGRFSSFRTDFNLFQDGTFLDSHYYSASIVLEYRKQLSSFSLEKEEPSTLVKSEEIEISDEAKESELSQKINKHFAFFNENCPRKHKKILKDSDFSKLITWTVDFFENDLNVPEISEPIGIVNTNKTYVQLAFKYLFKELHRSPYPDSLFTLYKSAFKSYEMDSKKNFDAVKNNDEVKKLMLIEY
jgi:hypothetical protein